MKKIAATFLLATALALPVTAAETVKPGDKDWAEKVAIDGMAEVQLGEMAEKKGGPKVKDFGKHMVTDHGKANDELKAVATKNGVKLPTKIDAEHQAVVDKLSKLSGADFDKAYLDEMVAAHKKAIAALETETKESQSPFKDWATKTLPTIKEHLKMAEADTKTKS
jgi:putative membrane protein